MGIELGVGSLEDGVEEGEVGDGRVEGGEHKIADAEERDAGGRRRGNRGTENQEEDLDDVVVALEVVQRGVSTEDLDDQVG